MMNVFSDDNFSVEVLKSDKLVLVDFWAPWCRPCMMFMPILEKVAGEMETVKIGKLNTMDNPVTVEAYGIMSIPTLILFKNGVEVGKLMGFTPEARLKEFITKGM
jgi:thioredoxin 1